MEFDEEDWLDEQQDIAQLYMEKTGAQHGKIEKYPSFYVAPYLAVWAVESGKITNAVGWWVITGDVPTDYVSSSGVGDARAALRAFAERWHNSVELFNKGIADPAIRLNSETASLLEERTKILSDWVLDDSKWK